MKNGLLCSEKKLYYQLVFMEYNIPVTKKILITHFTLKPIIL